MSRSDYVEIGGILTTKKGKKYECVDQSELGVCGGCGVCDFYNRSCHGIKCIPEQRADNKNVSFKRRKDLENRSDVNTEHQVHMMEDGASLSVGTIAVFSDGRYLVVPDGLGNCSGCDIMYGTERCHKILCSEPTRHDKQSVIFVKEQK